ncbi:MAG: DUF4340 domain-containing protein [bacterium]|nr:DUF4340 domain-containing protein [bacterium]
MGNLKWLLIGLGGLLVVFLVTQSMQSKHQVQSDRVFPDNKDGIQKFEVEQQGKSLALLRQDTLWVIVGSEGMKVRDYLVEGFLKTVLDIKRETLMTKKAENWEKYSLDDSTGTHVRLYDAGDNLIASAVFGRSLSDWSRNYVRIGDHPEVYLTESTVLHLLSNRADHWGEAPKPSMPDMMMGETVITATREDGSRIIDTLRVIEEK